MEKEMKETLVAAAIDIASIAGSRANCYDAKNRVVDWVCQQCLEQQHIRAVGQPPIECATYCASCGTNGTCLGIDAVAKSQLQPVLVIGVSKSFQPFGSFKPFGSVDSDE